MEHNDQQQQNAPASQACAWCRKHKRKCDKQTPSCTLCIRIGRQCDYSTNDQAAWPTPEDFSALQQKVTALEGLVTQSTPSDGRHTSNSNGSSSTLSNSYINGKPSFLPLPGCPGPTTFPALFFLDSDAFEYERFKVQLPIIKMPPGVLMALGNSTQLRAIIEEYFASVHTYLPIISKMKLYQQLANSLHEPGPDIALLFLTMKLIASELPGGISPQTQLYADVKSFFHYVELQNGFSIHMLQAQLLISLYELGHAIYPASYLSIGHAARLGHAMGIHESGAPQMLPRQHTWTEQEERRRVWWAVIILDRYINVGHRGKPFASSDPSLDTHLPTDDGHWDRGQMLAAAPLALSASPTIKVGPFARICQASHLLGKVSRHINDKTTPENYHIEDALQLHRTMRALTTALLLEADQDSENGLTLCSSLAICYSAVLTLYDAYSCSERMPNLQGELRLRMQKESIEGLREITTQALHLARRIRSFVEQAGLAKLSPLLIDSLYQAAANFSWYVRESSDLKCTENLNEVKELLVSIDRRWKVASQYLSAVEGVWETLELPLKT